MASIIEVIAIFIFVIGLINNHWFTGNNIMYFLFIVVTLATIGLYLIASVAIKLDL